MKTYVFVIPSAFRVNAILRTKIYSTLVKNGTKIIIVSPFANDNKFKTEFPEAVHILQEPLPLKVIRRISSLRDITLSIDRPLLVNAKRIEQSAVKRKAIHTDTAKESSLRIFRFLLYPIRPVIFWLFNKIEERFCTISIYDNLFKNEKIAGIILGTVTEPNDIVWLAHSRRWSIPAHAVDLPWSYIENRIWSMPRIAHLHVWNDAMKDQLQREFSFPENLIHIQGSQRYDFYADSFPTYSRESFFELIHADPHKRLITQFIGTSYWNPHEYDITRLLLEAIQNGTLPHDTQVLVRLGWKQSIDNELIDLQKLHSNLLIQQADTLPEQTYPSHLTYFSDVTLSTFSSLAIDAAVLDKPHIYTGFSGLTKPHPDDAGISEIFKYKFIDDAVKTGGVSVAYDAKTLLSRIAHFMDDPSFEREERKRFSKTFLGTIGTAGTKIAQTILQS